MFVDDVLFQGQEQGRQFLLFFLGYFELVENLAEDFQRPVPIGFGDAGTGVRGFHVAAGIDARAAARLANKVDQQLADAELAVGGEADEETLLLLVVRQPRNEFIGDGGNGVVAAEPLIQRFVFGLGRTGQQRECENFATTRTVLFAAMVTLSA